VASLIATYAAVFFQAGIDRLRPGERALVQCLPCDRDQARIVLGCTGVLGGPEILRHRQRAV
jgi:hypothetical protein